MKRVKDLLTKGVDLPTRPVCQALAADHPCNEHGPSISNQRQAPHIFSLKQRATVTTVVATKLGWVFGGQKKETVKVRVAESYLSLIPVRHHPSFVATMVKTVLGYGRG